MQFTNINADDIICDNITIADDDIIEGTEEFSVTITLPVPDERVELDNSSASITIIDTSRKKMIVCAIHVCVCVCVQYNIRFMSVLMQVCMCVQDLVNPNVNLLCRCSTWPGRRSLHCQ